MPEPTAATPSLRLAYADPPYPGKAHLYPESTEVDHGELIKRLEMYDGWALSTDERSLKYVLALSPNGVRVLAWCRGNGAFGGTGNPLLSWEPVICSPARTKNVSQVSAHFKGGVPRTGRRARFDNLTGQKPAGFCEWVLRCMGFKPGDIVDDLFPGTGIMGRTVTALGSQLSFDLAPSSWSSKSFAARSNMMRRIADPLPGMDAPGEQRERNRGKQRAERKTSECVRTASPERCDECRCFPEDCRCGEYDDRDEYGCTICGGDGTCMDNSDPLWDCDDLPHACHSCGGTGRRSVQRYM